MDGFQYLPEYLSRQDQESLVETLRQRLADTPLYTPIMPRSARPLSVQMTNFGSLGWLADKTGYRYVKTHPVTGKPWPNIPEPLLNIWEEVSQYPAPPDACLLNYYNENARMGLHVDKDEVALNAPVVSISLGDTARFRLGGVNRKDPTHSMKLHSGDIVILGGPARLAHHGIDRIYAGTSTLLKQGGRINLTMRKVTVD